MHIAAMLVRVTMLSRQVMKDTCPPLLYNAHRTQRLPFAINKSSKVPYDM